MMVRGFLETPVPNDIAYSPATVAQSVAEGLRAKGHEVFFYGPEGTDVNVTEVISDGLRPAVRNQDELDKMTAETELFKNYRPSLYDQKMARAMLEDARTKKYDCVIFNHFESVLPLAGLFPDIPIVHILHDYIDQYRREVIEMHASPNQHFISISSSQRRDAPDLPYADTVYNGIDTEIFTADGDPEDYLMIAGRITPDKGIKEAVQIAIQTKRRLLIIGSLLTPDYWYFEENIKPYLDDKILFLGMLDRGQLIKYYQKAAGLLMPIQWQEPFGLAVAEAGSCGTPVIAFNRGSMPELIKDGKTGYLVNNSAEMIMAIDKLDKIKRSDCRDHIEKNFSIDNMIDGYEKALYKIVNQTRSKARARDQRNASLGQQMRRISKRLLNP